MASDAHITLDNLESNVDQRLAALGLERMVATAIGTDGRVALRSVLSATGGAKKYSRLLGPAIEVDDYVLTLKNAGTYIVLGKMRVDETDILLYDLPIDINVVGGHDRALVIRDGVNDLFVYDSNSLIANFLSGTVLLGYNAADALKWEIDSESGIAEFAGLNMPAFDYQTQDAPTDSSNTSNTIWDTAFEQSIVLPTGTWTVWALAIGSYTNASQLAVRQRTQVDVTSGDYWQLTCDVIFPTTIASIHTATGKTGTITCYAEYQPANNGVTAGAKGGAILIWGMRTA
jgi:hypothetical protein